ncbi:hypothetical protein SDC9_49867 [bioreactor metagenome]|uniref:Uncharacterized protein n=1 Tax=bioreactor metagenome TaxID=1076179 RepID=A0A644WIN7_9ZZZZ
MGVQGGRPGGFIFLQGQERLQLFVFVCPRGLAVVERVRKAAPANIPGEDFLFLRRSRTALGLYGLQCADGFDVGMKLGLRAASAQGIVGDAEVFGGRLDFRCCPFRLRVTPHEPQEALLAFRTENGVQERGVTELNVKRTDSFNDKVPAVLQIHDIARSI